MASGAICGDFAIVCHQNRTLAELCPRFYKDIATVFHEGNLVGGFVWIHVFSTSVHPSPTRVVATNSTATLQRRPCWSHLSRLLVYVIGPCHKSATGRGTMQSHTDDAFIEATRPAIHIA